MRWRKRRKSLSPRPTRIRISLASSPCSEPARRRSTRISIARRPKKSASLRRTSSPRCRCIWDPNMSTTSIISEGRIRLIAQADGGFRQDPQDVARLKARNTSGEMVPVGTVARLKYENAPYRVLRYNLFRDHGEKAKNEMLGRYRP